MTDAALFEVDERPLRERVAATIMPPAFGSAKDATWAADARRRALVLADEILAIVEVEPARHA